MIWIIFFCQEQFDLLQEKLAAPDQAQLADEFAKLRQITADYTVPADVCDSYAAVYQMLAELDQAYHLAKKKN